MYDWLWLYLKRHQNLILKKSYPLEKKRVSITSEQVEKQFEVLSKIIRENNSKNLPGQIFNCNESGKNNKFTAINIYRTLILHQVCLTALIIRKYWSIVKLLMLIVYDCRIHIYKIRDSILHRISLTLKYSYQYQSQSI